MKLEDDGHGLKFKGGEPTLMRRVQGYHDLRLDGMSDLLHRARNASVFDIGCNRGHAGFEFANNGATRVMGCDIYENGIIAARHMFCDLRAAQHRFEVVDLTGGPVALQKAFGKDAELSHDFTLMLATYHKLKRIEGANKWLPGLMRHFGNKTAKYFAWRGFEDEIKELDDLLGQSGLKRIHTSFMSDIQPCAVWKRK